MESIPTSAVRRPELVTDIRPPKVEQQTLTVKALYELERVGGRYALVTLCIGGGQGIAAIYERV